MKKSLDLDKINQEKKDELLNEIINIAIEDSEFYSDVGRNVIKLLVRNKLIEYEGN
ncbi:hypothetical protein [Clostridium perfringens]|uniref:Uncharacterized protein n=1 Tax=Clostridium perfringens TaxID=1502 RepID=A0A140GRT4_CLOPF|nr:hypothetical protein [Clostridium perfringens]AMN31243.1 hypothetical protein JFP838_pA0327 [Clostridium perfringens]